MKLDEKRLIWGGFGGLVFILLLEWVWPSPSPPPIAAHKPRLIDHAEPQEAARDTSGWADTILGRPLFSVSRRPPRVVRSSGSQTAIGQARLSGIMISAAGRRAIFAPDGGGKQLVLSEGASVNDTTIRRIQPDRVILASGAILQPTYDRNRSPATTAPFQPGLPNPGFAVPGFPNPGFPNPGFPNPNFPNPAFQNPGIPQPPPGGEDGNAGSPPLPNPRNPMIPQRRDQ
jgi:hypothetical protein